MPSEQQFPGESAGDLFSIRGDREAPDATVEQATFRDRLRALREERERSTADTLRALLELGAEWLGVEQGSLTDISPADGTHTIVAASGSSPNVEEGATAELSNTYCRVVLAEGNVLAIENAPEQGWSEDSAYQHFGFSTYLGAKVVVDGQLSGTACFVDREPRGEPFCEADIAVLASVVQAIEHTLERSRRENQLRPIPARLRALFAGSPDMIHLHDAEGNILLPNPPLCEKTGYEEEELTRMKVWELAPDVSADEARAPWQEMEPGDRHRTETRYRRKEGSLFPVEVNRRRLDLEEDDWFVAAARDRTVHEEKKQELRHEEERFQSFIQEVEEYAIFMLGPEGHVRSWNEGAERIKGYSEAEIIGEPLSTFYTEEDREAGLPEENLRRAEREGSVRDEGWRVRKDGSRFWASVTITALQEDGTLRGFAKVTQDLTDRKKRERRYEAIFNQTYQFIGLMEPDGTLIEANDTALQFGGIDREDVVGEPFWDAHWWQVDDETQRELREAIDRAAEGEFVRYDVEVQGEDENIIVDFSIRPVRNEAGEVTLLIPEGRNITELKTLKRREHELEQTRNLLAQAQQLADVGGWRLDLKGDPPHRPEWTDELYDLFGVPRDAVPSVETVLGFFSPEDREERRAAIDRALESGEGWDQESRMVTVQGTERWVRSIGRTLVENGEVVALHGALQDITERKEREEQLERQNQRLEQFASLVSHDLRGPLNVAKGRLALAREDDDPRHLAAADRALERMDALIEDVLTLTWGGQEIDPDEVDFHGLTALAKESWDCVETANASLRVESTVNLQAEEGRLRRLLENLFRNAVEHGGEAVTVLIGGLADGFYVEDDGPGIPEDKREKVLEGGYSSREEGTGLGLSIVQATADTHGWALSIGESEEGGARFEIRNVNLMTDEGKSGSECSD